MGKNMRAALTFISKCGGWHTFDRHCRATIDAIKRLERRGLVETNKYYQFKLIRS